MKRAATLGCGIVAILVVASAAVGSLATWHVIASQHASGDYADTVVSGAVDHPEQQIAVRVTAIPNQHVTGNWNIVCSKGYGAGSKSGSFSGQTPLVHAMTLPMSSPDSCTAAGGAQLDKGGQPTVSIVVGSPSPSTTGTGKNETGLSGQIDAYVAYAEKLGKTVSACSNRACIASVLNTYIAKTETIRTTVNLAGAGSGLCHSKASKTSSDLGAAEKLASRLRASILQETDNTSLAHQSGGKLGVSIVDLASFNVTCG
jgi:hypothetical protein